MPPEWAPHAATWLSWPHNRDTWPGRFAAVEPAMTQIAAALAASEPVHINVLDAEHERHVARLLAPVAPSERIHLHRIPTNDAWIRDHGAVVVKSARARLAVCFGYNAWGGKYPPYDLDQQVAGAMAEILGVAAFRPGIVLEGGSIDVNGAGQLLATEQCLLNPNRNPDLSVAEIETVLRAALGVTDVLWLDEGIVGDDTDGHVDDIARFVGPRRIVTAIERERSDPNFAPLAANRRRLERLGWPREGDLEIVELPMPAPQLHDGERLPASYANFYIANSTVLLPVFACDADREAASILADCFPERRIVPIDCRDLVVGLGAIHCLTQQVPGA
jgi:agmatine deiminase